MSDCQPGATVIIFDPNGPPMMVLQTNGTSGNDIFQPGYASPGTTTNVAVASSPGVYTFQNVAAIPPGDGSETINANGGDDLIASVGGDDVIRGNDGQDTLWGGEGNDDATGSDGNDNVNGEGGSDSLYGEGGDDFLMGGLEADYICGGDDIDYALYHNSTTPVSASLEEGRGNAGDALGDVLTGIENLAGSLHADTLFGSGDIAAPTDRDNNIIVASDGDDVVYGLAGNDTVLGELGNDSLNGGAGDDVIIGGPGNDTIGVQ